MYWQNLFFKNMIYSGSDITFGKTRNAGEKEIIENALIILYLLNFTFNLLLFIVLHIAIALLFSFDDLLYRVFDDMASYLLILPMLYFFALFVIFNIYKEIFNKIDQLENFIYKTSGLE